MGVKEFLSNLGEKQKERKAMLNGMVEQMRLQQIAEDRLKPSSQRLIERYEKEKAEKFRKEYLEQLEKERDADFKFNHNPLNAKNVTGKTEWEVLKEKNLFNKNKCMFANQKNLFVGNKRLY